MPYAEFQSDVAVIQLVFFQVLAHKLRWMSGYSLDPRPNLEPVRKS